MSLPTKAEKYRPETMTKKVNIWATQEDLEALRDVINETQRMFSPDLIKDNDLPSRITISEDIDPEAVMYPRTIGYLRRLRDAFNEFAQKTADSMDIIEEDIPVLEKRGTRPNKIIAIVENILNGSYHNFGGLPSGTGHQYPDIMTELDGLVANPELIGKLKSAAIQAAYVQNLETHLGAYMTAKQKKDFDEMLEADRLRKDYPSDIGGYSQAYIMMLRSDDLIPMLAPTQIKGEEWGHFLISHGLTGAALDGRYTNPPRTMGDLLEFIFAYTAGRTMQMENAKVVPFATRREPIEHEVVYGTGEGNEVKGYKHLYKAVIVGSGPIHVTANAMRGARGSISNLQAAQVPGFFM